MNIGTGEGGGGSHELPQLVIPVTVQSCWRYTPGNGEMESLAGSLLGGSKCGPTATADINDNALFFFS